MAGLCLGVVGVSSAETAGTVVEYPVAYPNATHPEPGSCHPAQPGSTHEITFDHRGGDALWITGQNYGYVVRVSTTGEMTYFPMPEGSGPHGIEFDADGSKWVTELVGNKIARITPDGEVTEMAIPTHDSRPIAIVPEPGSDAMWLGGSRRGRSPGTGSSLTPPTTATSAQIVLDARRDALDSGLPNALNSDTVFRRVNFGPEGFPIEGQPLRRANWRRSCATHVFCLVSWS